MSKFSWKSTESALFYCNGDERKEEKMVSGVNFREEKTINHAIVHLRNNEHIKTAISSKIIKSAYIVSHDGKEEPLSFQEKERLDKHKRCDPEYLMQMISGNLGITPLTERTYPEAGIHMTSFMPEGICECGDEYDDIVLDDSFLQEKMLVFSRMSPEIISEDGIIGAKYILDIDLDYFHTIKALQPKDYDIFTNLVMNAEIITIAEESTCVELLKTDCKVTSDLLKEKLLELIKYILSKK